MSEAPTTRIVNCDGCTLCCRNAQIMLHPEHGDDFRRYVTIIATNPLTGLPARFIPPRPDGACHYLGDEGCTIWPDRPITCRSFDCAEAFKNTPRHVRRQRVRSGLYDPKLYERGREVLRAREGA